MSVLDATDGDSGIASAEEFLEVGGSFVVSALKWVLVLNVAIGWIVFWSNVARLNLRFGQTTGVIISATLAIGPVAVVLVWLVSREIGRSLSG